MGWIEIEVDQDYIDKMLKKDPDFLKRWKVVDETEVRKKRGGAPSWVSKTEYEWEGI